MENLGHDCHFSNQMWKFDVLAIPNLREMAARDAATADIVIVSCRGGSELPAQVKSWLELWLAQQSNAIALVALFDSRGEDTAQNLANRTYLAEAAKRGQMEFFAQPNQRPDGRQEEAHYTFNRTTRLNET